MWRVAGPRQSPRLLSGAQMFWAVRSRVDVRVGTASRGRVTVHQQAASVDKDPHTPSPTQQQDICTSYRLVDQSMQSVRIV